MLNNLLIRQTKSRARHSNDNALAETKNGSVIRKNIGYSFINKNKTSLSPAAYKEKKAALDEILIFAHADFLSLVESFLVNIQSTRPLMIPLIAESCKKRNKKETDCYLLKWSTMDGKEPERVRFKKDIVSFMDLAHFSSDLIQFLSDLAYSCTHAQAYLKSLQNEQ